MKRRYKTNSTVISSIICQRFEDLFQQAELAYSNDPAMANRYVDIAKKLSMRHKIRIPKEYRMRFCRHCRSYLKPGDNCRVRTRDTRIVYYCRICKKYMRFPFVKERKQRISGKGLNLLEQK